MGDGFFMSPILRSLGRGEFFKQVVSWVLRVTGIVTAIVAVVGAFLAIVGGFEASPLSGVGGIIFALCLGVAGFMAMQVMLHRANRVEELPDSGYAVLSVSAQLLKTLGEVTAIYAIMLGVGAGINTWLADGFAPLGATGFTGGLFVFGAGTLGGFVGLFVAYFMAETVNLFVNIANNTRKAATGNLDEEPISDESPILKRKAG